VRIKKQNQLHFVSSPSKGLGEELPFPFSNISQLNTRWNALGCVRKDQNPEIFLNLIT